MSKLDVKAIGDAIHENKLAHGWEVTTKEHWKDPKEILSVLMLIVTEVAEAAEGCRYNDFDNFKEELADIAIRLIGFAHGMGIDLVEEINKKMAANKGREYKHGGKRI